MQVKRHTDEAITLLGKSAEYDDWLKKVEADVSNIAAVSKAIGIGTLLAEIVLAYMYICARGAEACRRQRATSRCRCMLSYHVRKAAAGELCNDPPTNKHASHACPSAHTLSYMPWGAAAGMVNNSYEDFIAGHGELWSARLFAAKCKQMGFPVAVMDTRDVVVRACTHACMRAQQHTAHSTKAPAPACHAASAASSRAQRRALSVWMA